MIIPLMFSLVVQTGGASLPKLDLHLVPSGTFARVGGYRPFSIPVSEVAPKGVSGLPAGTEYGTLKFGSGSKERGYLVAIEEPVSVTSHIYVDRGGDGNLKEFPPLCWTAHPYKGSDGTQKVFFDASITIDLHYGGSVTPCVVSIYPGQPGTLAYYGDFSLQGTASLTGIKYDAIYWDSTACWDPKTGDGTLMIDTDHDGKFHPGYEFFKPNEPFNIKGTTYELNLVGGDLAVLRSAKTVKEKTLADLPGDPNLSNGLRPGKMAPRFVEKSLGGPTVSFPKSYAGKVVLLDFWATWCGPCMREVPNVAAVYSKYHSQGLEILGVSLDNPDSQSLIQKTTARFGMVWKQIYQAKGWDSGLVKLYGIKAIPATYLVDGDTGKILAMLDQLRGPRLEATVKQALATLHK